MRKGTHAGDRGGHHRHLTSTDTTAFDDSCADTTHSASFTADTDLTTAAGKTNPAHTIIHWTANYTQP